MALALIVLAIGSVLAGYVGVPAALGGTTRSSTTWRRASRPTPRPQRGPQFGEGRGGRCTRRRQRRSAPTHEGGLSETALMSVSILVAFAGIGIAWYFFLRNPASADAVAEAAAPVHTLLENKYYVDEIYDATIVEPIVSVSRGALWKSPTRRSSTAP
jgi:NADH-quinone oxidoreductase subunit L